LRGSPHVVRTINAIYFTRLFATGHFTRDVNSKTLAIAKKKLLAELELGGGVTITIQGKEITKNDILIFFDELQKVENIDYHIIVAEDPILLGLLEYNFLEMGDWFKKNEMYKDQGFIEWISPFYFTSFTTFAESCIICEDDARLKTLIRNPLLMTLRDTESAWAEVEQLIRKDLAELQHFVNHRNVPQWHEIEYYGIKHLFGYEYVGIILALPVDRFTILRDEYAYIAMQCATHVFGKVSKEKAHAITETALLLAVTEGMKEKISYKQAEMFNIGHQARKQRSTLIVKRCVLLLGIIFILYLFRLIAYDNQDGSNLNTNAPAADTSNGSRVELLEPPPPQQTITNDTPPGIPKQKN